MTITPHLSEIIGAPGVFELLRRLESSSTTFRSVSEIKSEMSQADIEDVDSTLGDLVAAGILRQVGDQVTFTRLGVRASLLLEAVNGGELRDVFRRLGRVDSTLRTYSLVREGMTELFLRNLNTRPGFRRIYFCSPWIRLGDVERDMLLHAMNQAGDPEILVITRPVEGSKATPPRSMEPFVSLGATVFLHPRLHTKLYIREPDASGGYSMAIVGSQNLTRSRYLELGVRINSDGQIIDQLISYFLEVTNYCTEAEGSSDE